MYTIPLYCTSTLYTFRHTVSSNHKSRLRTLYNAEYLLKILQKAEDELDRIHAEGEI